MLDFKNTWITSKYIFYIVCLKNIKIKLCLYYSMSASSRQRILNVMGTFRPAFRSVAQSLTDIDLILVEEAFERLLLDYDRVFSSMGIPACLWRRTGEIYKGNKEFAALVNVPIENLREGRLCIYELMAEESAVNYWEVSNLLYCRSYKYYILTHSKNYIEIWKYRFRSRTKGCVDILLA